MAKRIDYHSEDVEITHVKGSGPGGQHRNKRMTGIRLVHKPTGIVVMATERRSQEQNLGAAFLRLAEKLEAFFYKPPPRFKTKKTLAAKRRQLDAKKHRSSTKMARQKPKYSD